MNQPFMTYCCVMPSEPELAGRVLNGRSGALPPLAHMAWSAGPGLILLPSGGVSPVLRPEPSSGVRSADTRYGGLMVIDDKPYDRSSGDPRQLAQECLYICRSLGFTGLLCDFEQPARPMLEAFVRECADSFYARGYTVYVPERYANCHGAARVLIPTALTSGSLPSRLRQAVSLYGVGRVALEMERAGRDLILPNADGAGSYIAPESIPLLLASRGGTSFFSGELGARYFTYRDAEGRTHFVVYDDPGTFRYKTDLALQLGIREGFVLYPDMVGLGLL